MIKSDTSIRSLSHGRVTTVSIDTVMLADIKSLANGRTNVDYLRELVANDKKNHPQGFIATLSTIKDTHDKLNVVNDELRAIIFQPSEVTGVSLSERGVLFVDTLKYAGLQDLAGAELRLAELTAQVKAHVAKVAEIKAYKGLRLIT